MRPCLELSLRRLGANPGQTSRRAMADSFRLVRGRAGSASAWRERSELIWHDQRGVGDDLPPPRGRHCRSVRPQRVLAPDLRPRPRSVGRVPGQAVEFYRAVEQLPEMVAFRAGSGGGRTPARGASGSRRKRAFLQSSEWHKRRRSFDDALASDLLARIRDSDSTFFERLVLKLLVAMGYGGSEEEAAEAPGWGQRDEGGGWGHERRQAGARSDLR